jgi:hypothetical protein
MYAYKVELLIIDFDGLKEEGIATELENTKYGNHCINPSIMKIEGAYIGEWHNDHPLNVGDLQKEYKRLFP